MRLEFKNWAFDLQKRTLIMGILNVTPDSFSDGGLYLDKEAAIQRALAMSSEGADIIDIGGLSTRPGSEEIPIEEELKRVVPVIEALRGRLSIPISIDTYRAEVAEQALRAGADIVNDISGLRFDPKMKEVVSRYKAPIVIMHIKGTPRDMQKDPRYQNLIAEITDYLKEGIKIAKQSGIPEERIIIDPGIGFGKTLEHNLEIIRNLSSFKSLGRPILIGVSRKSFIGKILDDAPPSERLEGTLSAISISVFNGANIVRVHDVKEASKAVRIAHALRGGESPCLLGDCSPY